MVLSLWDYMVVVLSSSLTISGGVFLNTWSEKCCLFYLFSTILPELFIKYLFTCYPMRTRMEKRELIICSSFFSKCYHYGFYWQGQNQRMSCIVCCPIQRRNRKHVRLFMGIHWHSFSMYVKYVNTFKLGNKSWMYKAY